MASLLEKKENVFPTNRQQAPDLLDQVTSGYIVLRDMTCPEVTRGNVILCYTGGAVLLFIKQLWKGLSTVVTNHLHASFAKKWRNSTALNFSS